MIHNYFGAKDPSTLITLFLEARGYVAIPPKLHQVVRRPDEFRGKWYAHPVKDWELMWNPACETQREYLALIGPSNTIPTTTITLEVVKEARDDEPIWWRPCWDRWCTVYDL